jgi:hypothetical protein
VLGASAPVQALQTRWILPHPLILAPNEGFSGMIRISPNFLTGLAGTPTLSLVARGRRLAAGTPVPRLRAIPFVTGWMFTTAGIPAPDLVFRNSFGTVLHVTSINLTRSIWAPPPGALAATINGPGGLANTVLRGIVSGGFVDNFVAQRQAIEEAHDLEPGDSYQIVLSAAPQLGNGGHAVALVGWREE